MIIFEHKVWLPQGKTCYIVPIGDVHYNVIDADKARFHRLINWIYRKVEAGDLVKIIGMGDMCDTFSTSERDAIRGAKGGKGLHDTTLETFDKLAFEIADEFIEAILPIKNCFVGLLEGHHYMMFSHYSSGKFTGQSTTQYIASRLGCQYFGRVAKGDMIFAPSNLIKLKLGIVAHHGWGAGRTKGARLNKREQFGQQHPDANLVFMGHDHEKMIGVSQRLITDPASPDGLSMSKQYLIGTGSFLKGYQTDRVIGSYIEEAGLPPSELGVAMVKVETEKRDGRWRLDFHASI